MITFNIRIICKTVGGRVGEMAIAAPQEPAQENVFPPRHRIS